MNKQMGISKLGNSHFTINRKFRYTAEIISLNGEKILPQTFLRTFARPDLSVEKDLHESNDTTYHCRFTNRQFITFSLFDELNLETFYQWIQKLFHPKNDKINPIKLKICLYDGCGVEMDKWLINDPFVHTVNFGELDHSSSDIIHLELIFSYLDLEYQSKFSHYQFASPMKLS